MSLRHLWLAGVSLALAVAVGLALGLAVARSRWAEPVTRAVGVLQTIPGIALLAFMLPVLGIGAVPAVVALFLYSLYPIVRAAVTGLGEADRGAVEAARALGMTAAQVRPLRPGAAGGAGDHGRHPHRGGDQRRHRDAGGASSAPAVSAIRSWPGWRWPIRGWCCRARSRRRSWRCSSTSRSALAQRALTPAALRARAAAPAR